MAKADPLGVWLARAFVAELTPRRPWELHCPTASRRSQLAWPLPGVVMLPAAAESRMDASVYAAGCCLRASTAKRFGRAQSRRERRLLAAREVRARRRRRDCDRHRTPAARPPAVVPYTSALWSVRCWSYRSARSRSMTTASSRSPGCRTSCCSLRLRTGSWGRPAHGYPSSHILKIDDPLRPGLVAAEASVSTLAREMGLTNVEAKVLTIADRTAYSSRALTAGRRRTEGSADPPGGSLSGARARPRSGTRARQVPGCAGGPS